MTDSSGPVTRSRTQEIKELTRLLAQRSPAESRAIVDEARRRSEEREQKAAAASSVARSSRPLSAMAPARRRAVMAERAKQERKEETKAPEVKAGPAYTISEAAATFAAEIALRESAPAFEISAPVAAGLMRPSEASDREPGTAQWCRCCARRRTQNLAGRADEESQNCPCPCCENWRDAVLEAAVDAEIDRDDEEAEAAPAPQAATAAAPFQIGSLTFTPATAAETVDIGFTEVWSNVGPTEVPDDEADEGDEGDEGDEHEEEAEIKQEELPAAVGPPTETMDD